MHNAAKFQRSLMPNLADIHGLECASIYKPVEAVGGDLYAFERLDRDHVAVLVGDVVGHGLAAAMGAVVVLSAFKRLCMDCSTKRQISSFLMEELNSELTPLLHPSNMHCTAFIAVINTATGGMVYTRAGHPFPYIMRANPERLEKLVEANGPALGFNVGIYYEEQTAYLGKKDIVVCFTDGFTECRDEDLNQFGNWKMERAIEAGKGGPLEICESILAQTEAHCLKNFEDDITSLAFRRRAMYI